ncbi:hypothetical protein EXIGLDRAFT_725308 [Exidia glandulosa HHB12029]|uniref:Uncharacterized protein n=1 Tax=Exidia glandulosa HHB12029 TaxID=1314781 RepID=A0A165MJH0_EXIGL|nr:hypothetical protein EXIGLDRAFT_725308 [Exidia glandulosa HHB12029]
MAAAMTPSPAMPGMAVLLPDGLTPNMTIGAVTIGTWISLFALGIVLCSSYLYFLRFPEDRAWYKVIVGAITVVCIVDTIANLVWAYQWIVRLWGSVPGAGIIPHGFYINVFCYALACTLTQGFYGWRLLGFGRQNRPLVALILLSALVQQSFVVWVMVFWGHHTSFSQIKSIFPTAYGWLVTGIVGDALVSGGLIYYQRLKAQQSVKKPNMEFQAILSKSVQANVLALISQVLTLVLFKVDAGMFFLLNDVVIAKIYAFSLLTTLNVRSSSWAIFSVSASTKSHSEHISLSSMPRPAVVRITQTITIHEEEYK